MARWIESWMSPSPEAAPSGATDGHRGARFGIPASGSGSVSGFGRRLAAVTIDWLIAYLGCLLFTGFDSVTKPGFGWTVWLVWFVMTVAATAVFGATPGKVLLGTRVARVDMATFVGVPRALVRTLLLSLVVPALLRDEDGRGWHDRASRTIVVRTRG